MGFVSGGVVRPDCEKHHSAERSSFSSGPYGENERTNHLEDAK